MENKPVTVKDLMSSDDIMIRLKEILGKRASTFATSVIQLTSQNKTLAQCVPASVVGSAMVSATLDLPLNQSLGYAYVVPYNEKQEDGTYLKKAQFQIGYKGFIQLAQRSGQFKTIHTTEVKEGEIQTRDRLTGNMEYQWIDDDKERAKLPTVGYVAYFKLLNGFEATLYMSKDEVTAHGKKFSQTFKKNFGLWKDDFDSMAKKTVLKLLLSKYAPLSIEMQKAVTTDQALINDLEGNDVKYLDNETTVLDHEEVSQAKEEKRVKDHIEKATTLEELKQAEEGLSTIELQQLYIEKEKALKKTK